MARILLVEDDPALSRGIFALLKTAGHAADGARDGETALFLLESEPFSLLILDIGLPGFVSGQPLTTDTATYDIIGRTYYVGFKSKF
jgi:DNA-binding response OmpR family regulator